jgi:hypothetical protein
MSHKIIGETLVRAEIIESEHGHLLRVGGVCFAVDELEIVMSEKRSDISDLFGPSVGPPAEKPIKGVDSDDMGF